VTPAERRDENLADRFEAPPRCLCYNGTLPGLADRDIPIGLNAALGLVSDECGLICDDCTTRLIETNALHSGNVLHRRRRQV